MPQRKISPNNVLQLLVNLTQDGPGAQYFSLCGLMVTLLTSSGEFPPGNVFRQDTEIFILGLNRILSFIGLKKVGKMKIRMVEHSEDFTQSRIRELVLPEDKENIHKYQLFCFYSAYYLFLCFSNQETDSEEYFNEICTIACDKFKNTYGSRIVQEIERTHDNPSPEDNRIGFDQLFTLGTAECLQNLVQIYDEFSKNEEELNLQLAKEKIFQLTGKRL